MKKNDNARERVTSVESGVAPRAAAQSVLLRIRRSGVGSPKRAALKSTVIIPKTGSQVLRFQLNFKKSGFLPCAGETEDRLRRRRAEPLRFPPRMGSRHIRGPRARPLEDEASPEPSQTVVFQRSSARSWGTVFIFLTATRQLTPPCGVSLEWDADELGGYTTAMRADRARRNEG